MGQGAATAIRILIRELGILRGMRAALRVRSRERSGEPFRHLAAPGCEREAKSRAQIAPAILLYQELLKLVPRPDALRITERIVVAGALKFLRKTVGPIGAKRLVRMSDEQRRRWVEKTGEAFFNATVEWRRVDEREVRFDVTACRFPALCREAGVPELAPVFCKGDALFFRGKNGAIAFDRTQTIAEGAPLCDFRIRASGES